MCSSGLLAQHTCAECCVNLRTFQQLEHVQSLSVCCTPGCAKANWVPAAYTPQLCWCPDCVAAVGAAPVLGWLGGVGLLGNSNMGTHCVWDVGLVGICVWRIIRGEPTLVCACINPPGVHYSGGPPFRGACCHPVLFARPVSAGVTEVVRLGATTTLWVPGCLWGGSTTPVFRGLSMLVSPPFITAVEGCRWAKGPTSRTCGRWT